MAASRSKISHLLKQHLYNRHGGLTIPTGPASAPVPPDLQLLTFTSETPLGTFVTEPAPESKLLRTFMRDNFYRLAIVPKLLGLGPKEACPAREKLVQQEMDMYFNSGTTQTWHLAQTGELVSVSFNCIWDTDPTYDAFELKNSDWFHVAGELANGEAESDGDRVAIWRNFHYLWLYHLFQREAQRQNKPFIYYGAMQYVRPGLKEAKLGFTYWMNHSKRIGTTPEYYVGGMGTFAAFDSYFSIPLRPYVQQIAFASYADLKLSIGGQENIFDTIKHQKGMTVLGSSPISQIKEHFKKSENEIL